MYYVKKVLEISAAHSLCLDYESKCENLHGHNWKITVECRSEKLNNNGMVVDFTHIKDEVMKYDHKNLNDIFDGQSSAERLAAVIWSNILFCFRVTVEESSGNTAIYEGDK